MPVEWAHGEVIVFVLPDSKLFLEVLEGIELARGVEILVVFPVHKAVTLFGCQMYSILLLIFSHYNRLPELAEKHSCKTVLSALSGV